MLYKQSADYSLGPKPKHVLHPLILCVVLKQVQDAVAETLQIEGVVLLFYVLLALAIVISVIGIVNTLFLSIYERTRELGMLRAIGMSRRQVRSMIRYEAVITALIGAVLGLILGIVFAALIAQPLKAEGFVLSYPVPTLIGILVLAALLGVIAAVIPARRASPVAFAGHRHSSDGAPRVVARGRARPRRNMTKRGSEGGEWRLSPLARRLLLARRPLLKR